MTCGWDDGFWFCIHFWMVSATSLSGRGRVFFSLLDGICSLPSREGGGESFALECLNCQPIAVEAEAADDAAAGGADGAVVAELLALMHVGDMYLDYGRWHGLDGIVQRDARVRICSGIEDDAVDIEAYGVNAVDEVALVVALVVAYLHAGALAAQLREVVLERAVAIDLRFAAAQQVEVGAVNDFYSFHSMEGNLCLEVVENLCLGFFFSHIMAINGYINLSCLRCSKSSMFGNLNLT